MSWIYCICHGFIGTCQKYYGVSMKYIDVTLIAPGVNFIVVCSNTQLID